MLHVEPLPATHMPPGGAPWQVSPPPHTPPVPHEQLLA
jgi:hypothetical protein